jgi:hypothetical protein
MGLAGGYPARENRIEHLLLRVLASHCFGRVFHKSNPKSAKDV